VSGLDLDPQRAAAVSAIGAFAGQLDAWLVAEGIENERELERLIDLGVPLAQGFLLGRPERQMRPLPAVLADQVRVRHGLPAVDRLSALARPAPVAREAPALIAEATILVDDHGRPRRVVVPAGGRRSHRHAAMCVAPGEEVRDVALRAVARQSEDRYGPLCLCDEAGAPLGLIMIESLLEALARDRQHP
jgi:EAL domain